LRAYQNAFPSLVLFNLQETPEGSTVEPKLRFSSIRSVPVKLLRRLQVPATESQLALTLAISLVMMAALLLGILWQANVINYQKEMIRALWNSKFAG
jgi:hypothetical protein